MSVRRLAEARILSASVKAEPSLPLLLIPCVIALRAWSSFVPIPSFHIDNGALTRVVLACSRERTMPWPRRARLTEVELKRQNETLALQLVRLREQLTSKQDYASRLEFLLHERMERIDELNAKLELLREQNRSMLAPK